MSGSQQQEDVEYNDEENIKIDADEVAELISSIQESQYFDASSMAPLTPASMAAIARLRAYKPPPFAVWDRLPLSRRAAVLLLLFADRHGDLRVVITMRASTLRNYSGHAAFPGGKADTLEETPWQTARREASEEIGLPVSSASLPHPFRIEHLCELPYSLARTALAVRPCVAFLHSDDENGNKHSDVEENMIPRLDAKEVAAVFSAPFHNFLRKEDEVRQGDPIAGKITDWYKGEWMDWNDSRWRMHSFFVPVNNQKVTKPRIRPGAIPEHVEKEESDVVERYKVWGMTARILVDAARIAYEEEPNFELNTHIGDEPMIANLERMGKLGEKAAGGSDVTDADLQRARAQNQGPASPSDSKI
ncbi:hypothetical protein HYFRA_00000090 [Hymenoscyphus fraxineus]|uniref:Nudix hydrolase domain-containing protein n=1 Tax=Hymenoscyphus fraxineus TaxID=746836 RepID=A0A9N9L583_9HELO|nr:hypothetical protein HYFRA_00000090 [Hymenoscyphus fraxineus]